MRYAEAFWVAVTGGALTVALVVMAVVFLAPGPFLLLGLAIWLAVSSAWYWFEDRRDRRRRNEVVGE